MARTFAYRIPGRPTFLVISVVLATLFLFPSVGAPKGKSLKRIFSVDVPPSKSKSLRLRNVPKGTKVGIEIRSNGDINVFLLNEEDFRLYPAPLRPLFQGETARRLTLTVVAPRFDNYYLVLNNRAGSQSKNVTVSLDIKRSPPKNTSPGRKRARLPISSDTQKTVKIAAREIQRMGKRLKQIFIFKPFPIYTRRCNRVLAYTNTKKVLFCMEYARKFLQVLGDSQKAVDAIVFTVLHEVGHVLLAQWKYPFFDNEDAADEFATVLLVLLGQKHRALAKAEFFAANPSRAEALAKSTRDDRHALSVQRARNIIRWTRDPNFLRKWQKVFVSHMQTGLLKRLKEHPAHWTDLHLIEKELLTRR